MTPEAILREAVRKAQAVLAAHIEPDGPSEKETIKALLAVFDDGAVVRAVRIQQVK